jgi:translation initiation factor 2 beta subunit (eIF-2beta)/eIF-5
MSTKIKMTDMTDIENFTYDIDYLLDRAYGSFTLDRGNDKLVRPIYERKDRKSYIHNFQDVCASLNRTPEEVRVYLAKELNMDTSIKEDGSLKIDGMAKSAGMIEGFIKQYVIDHIMCKSCKSRKTHIRREDRITFLECDTCKSSYAVKK